MSKLWLHYDYKLKIIDPYETNRQRWKKVDFANIYFHYHAKYKVGVGVGANICKIIRLQRLMVYHSQNKYIYLISYFCLLRK